MRASSTHTTARPLDCRRIILNAESGIACEEHNGLIRLQSWQKPFLMLLQSEGLTPRLTGAGSRRLEGTNISHENAEGMAYVGVRVEPPVRLGIVGRVFDRH